MRLPNKLSVTASMIALAFGLSSSVNAEEASTTAFKAATNTSSSVNKKLYIVKMAEEPGIARALNAGEMQHKTPAALSPQDRKSKRYNSRSQNARSYADELKAKQIDLLKSVGKDKAIYHYKHSFNGFSATLTPAQVAKLKGNPNVVSVWEDQLVKPTTANTPTFLGLNDGDGLHTSGVKGEGVIVGILDTGITPEHPSFADDGTYSDPASVGWAGVCDAGEEAGATPEEATFKCNNKLVGARYFKDAFESAYELIPAEFISPRDADGHGNHVAGTAAGNEGIPADLYGTPVGVVTGMAPRARVAAYKVCWNSDADDSGCFFGDIMAGIEAAITDGVDVLNMSIGGSLTDLTTPTADSFLWANYNGVFSAVSAGNEGPTPGTVGTPAPWVTNVAASTYDGESAANILTVPETSPTLAGSEFISVEGAVTAPLAILGDTQGLLAVGAPLEGCSPLTNPAEIAGKVALISRGSCAFADKVLNAQDAGAVAILVYNNRPGSPIAMGGSAPGVAIPGMMVDQIDGEFLRATVEGGDNVEVLMSASAFTTITEVGNIMADFSSRGPNQSTFDVIKPDITAPGVKILAATTDTPAFAPPGERFRYLQGTSMSSPHIAGLAALMYEAHPGWSVSAIKSALMTTARQNVVKEDGVTPADPFDYGAGHVVPNSAANPGLVYDANIFDYLAFMCGLNEAAFVAGYGLDCPTLTDAGYPDDPSQLNIPSIAIAELDREEAIVRYVTNVGGDSTYTASFEMPAGVTMEVITDSADGSLTLLAGETKTYQLVLTLTDDAVYDEWVFGSITWTDENGHVVRSPIAVVPVPPKLVDAPTYLSMTATGPVAKDSYVITTNYNGRLFTTAAGMAPTSYEEGIVFEDADNTFEFLEDGLGVHFIDVPEGTRIARFAISDDLIDAPNTDLDLFVWRCQGFSCSQVGLSASASSNEEVTLIDPVPAADFGVGDIYVVMIHGYSLAGAESTGYTLKHWLPSATSSDTIVRASSRAREGRGVKVRMVQKDITPGESYLGVVSYKDQHGIEHGTTVVEIFAEEEQEPSATASRRR